MAMFEISSVAEGVRKFYEACYKLEGESCLIMRALYVFRRMEQYIENGYRISRLGGAVDIALLLLQSVESNHAVQVQVENKIVTMEYGRVTDMQTELNRLNGLKKEVQGSKSSQSRIRVRTEYNQDNDQLYDILERFLKQG